MNCNQVHQEFTTSVDSVVRDRFGPPAIRVSCLIWRITGRGGIIDSK